MSVTTDLFSKDSEKSGDKKNSKKAPNSYAVLPSLMPWVAVLSLVGLCFLTWRHTSLETRVINLENDLKKLGLERQQQRQFKEEDTGQEDGIFSGGKDLIRVRSRVARQVSQDENCVCPPGN